MNLSNAIIAAVVLVAAVGIAGRCHSGAISEWEDRVERVQRLAEAEKARAEGLKREADEHETRADSLARALRERAPEIRERIVRVEVETPDSLRDHPAITARDSIITDLRSESAGWKQAFEEQQRATAKLRVALETTEAVRDSLSNVLDDRPGDRPWWLPRLNVGPGLGYNGDDGVHADPVAVTLSWEIDIG